MSRVPTRWPIVAGAIPRYASMTSGRMAGPRSPIFRFKVSSSRLRGPLGRLATDRVPETEDVDDALVPVDRRRDAALLLDDCLDGGDDLLDLCGRDDRHAVVVGQDVV